ncbi:choline/ethanolamine kinase-like isoform X1 [Styela clava]
MGGFSRRILPCIQANSASLLFGHFGPKLKLPSRVISGTFFDKNCRIAYYKIASMAEMLLKRKPPKNEVVMDEEKMEVHDRAYKLCKEYLGGKWSELKKNEFQLSVLGGGLTNKLFICQIPKEIRDSNSKVPHTILLRLYGLIIQDFVAQIQESVVFSILSERGVGPHLYAVFPGGRLEEYLPCQTLMTKDLHDQALSRHIAKQMAIYHKLVMPVKKEPTCIMSRLQLYYETAVHMKFDDHNNTKLLNLLREYDLENELKYIKKLVADTDSPVVFCHNDVQEGNLLHMDNTMNPVQMIDFEYSGYNYRGFDIGNHFCEWAYDYSYSEWPFYLYKDEDYPTKEQQINFIQSYIREYFSTNSSHSQSDEKWQVDFMIKEANRFALLSHFFWAMWSVVQAKMSDISFGYMEYAHSRMDHYFKQKAEIE